MSAIGATPLTLPVNHPVAVSSGTIRHPLSLTLLVLTFTTGLVDAVSYLGIGHVFTANMTGNIVFLGFGIAGSGGLLVVAPLISLGAFLAGAGAGGVLASRRARGDPRGGSQRPRKRSLGRCGDRVARVGDGRSQRDDSPGCSALSNNDRAHDDVDRPGRRLATIRRL
jgi:hypothetical protein